MHMVMHGKGPTVSCRSANRKFHKIHKFHRFNGPGLSDDKFLPYLEKLIGARDVLKRSSSTSGRNGRSVSSSMQREFILEVSDLGHCLEAVPSLPARAFRQDCSNSCTSLKSLTAKM